MEFREEIKRRLKALNKKQICQFAWLCGVRALPFLSVQSSFIYWRENDRQTHLYSVFDALDVSVQTTFLDDDVNDFDRLAYAFIAEKVAEDAAAAGDAAAAARSSSASYVTAYAASYAAADAARVAAKGVTAADAVIDAACIAAGAVSGAVEQLLLKDIEAIKINRLDKCEYGTAIYGEVWGNFQESLKAIDCAYWAELYENLFKNGFDKLDKKELGRRMSIPNEIKAQGAAAVGRYLEKLGDKVDRLNEARIIILGEKGAGKTSLAKRLLDVDAPMPKEDESTEGVTTTIWLFKGKDGADVNAHVWDFAGHSITHSAHRCFMSTRCLYIYVYNGRIERDNDPAYWLEQIRIHGGESPVLFLINEKDGHKADIAERTLKKDYPSIVDYYRVDIGSKKKKKLKNFRQIVMDTVRNNPSWNSQVVSEETYKIKDKLRKYFGDTKDPHITRDKFDEIARDCGVPKERIEGILKDLHTLGICLWYDREEMGDFNTLVLNPDWITNGIYKIINEGFKEDEHILSVKKGTEILKNDKKYKYPYEKVEYLFKLMKLYELAFFKNDKNIFIPGILKLDMPDGLPAFDDYKDRLTMVFKVEKVLPPNIVARIIVQRYEDIFDEKLLWRKGAVLKYKDGNAIALIEEGGQSVAIKVKGADKTNYITSLRETIKAIFDDYKVIKPDLLYEVFIPETISSAFLTLKSEMLPEKTIQSHVELDELYLDPNTSKKYSLKDAAQVYNINIYANNVTLTKAENIGKIQTVGEGEIQEEIFNFYDCTINIQGDLNSLARSLKNGCEDDEDAKELLLAAEEMEQVQKLIPADVDEVSDEVETEVRKKGLLNRLKSIYDDLNDENSELYKKASKVKRGIETAQKIAKQYNDIAQWFGLPTVPKPFLGNQG